MDSTLTQLSPTALAILNNAEMRKMYQDNAKVGAQNISTGAPYLTIFSAGKSKSLLANGERPTDGYFFYKPTKTQYKELDVHILTISRGFKADGANDKKDVFNQIVGGVMVIDNTLTPFVMFLNGLKLQPMWDFGKLASQYTKNKQLPIPMFALSVKLTTRIVTHKNGESWVADFTIQKDAQGNPKIIGDASVFTQIKSFVETAEEAIEELVATKATGEVAPSPAADLSEIDAF